MHGCGGMGSGLPRSAQRHVRLRALGRKAQTLFLARDRLGEKPLYYSLLDDGDLVFASELKSLLCHPGLSRAIDPRAIEEYFAYGYIPDPRSIYRGVHKLPPAHYLLIERGRGVPAPRPYWDVAFSEDYRASESAIRDELIARLREVVRMRLIADVPLGAFLSGGVRRFVEDTPLASGSSTPSRAAGVERSEGRYSPNPPR